jgi:toxin ParE1/3/4
MAEVEWSPRAVLELEAARTYIAQFSPLAAQRIAVRLKRAGESLAEFPERGRATTGARRELATVPPYIITYRVRGDVVTILQVRHASRRRS